MRAHTRALTVKHSYIQTGQWAGHNGPGTGDKAREEGRASTSNGRSLRDGGGVNREREGLREREKKRKMRVKGTQ